VSYGFGLESGGDQRRGTGEGPHFQARACTSRRGRRWPSLQSLFFALHQARTGRSGFVLSWYVEQDRRLCRASRDGIDARISRQVSQAGSLRINVCLFCPYRGRKDKHFEKKILSSEQDAPSVTPDACCLPLCEPEPDRRQIFMPAWRAAVGMKTGSGGCAGLGLAGGGWRRTGWRHRCRCRCCEIRYPLPVWRLSQGCGTGNGYHFRAQRHRQRARKPRHHPGQGTLHPCPQRPRFRIKRTPGAGVTSAPGLLVATATRTRAASCHDMVPCAAGRTVPLAGLCRWARLGLMMHAGPPVVSASCKGGVCPVCVGCRSVPLCEGMTVLSTMVRRGRLGANLQLGSLGREKFT
jgi:hypothetical protein